VAQLRPQLGPQPDPAAERQTRVLVSVLALGDSMAATAAVVMGIQQGSLILFLFRAVAGGMGLALSYGAVLLWQPADGPAAARKFATRARHRAADPAAWTSATPRSIHTNHELTTPPVRDSAPPELGRLLRRAGMAQRRAGQTPTQRKGSPCVSHVRPDCWA